MKNKWRRATLGDLVSLQRGHDLTEDERNSGNVPVMGSAGKNGYHDTAIAKGPGVVIGRSGASFGQVHICMEDYWPHNTSLYVTDFYGNDPRFVFYFLKSLDFTRYNSGSAQPSLNRNYIYPIDVEIPPVEDQRTIARILGALDDKIELNRRMNQTLEAMARALFKSWFIDFDGVPLEDMQESDLGLIPKGWKIIGFGDVAQQGIGSVTPENAPEVLFSHYSLPAFDAAQLPLQELGKTIKSNKTPVPNEAVLVSKLNPHIPRIWLVGEAGSNAVCSTEFIVWTAKSPANTAFLFALASSVEFNSAICQLVTGTSNSHQRVRPEQIANIRIIAADDEAIKKFSIFAEPMMQKLLHNRYQSRTLTQLRDTLLPKLISGELRIKDIDRITETA